MGARSSKELIDEIKLMYSVLENVEDYTEEQVTSKTTQIKKLFNHFLKEHRIKGTLKDTELTAIKKVLLPMYKDMKSYPAITEILEQIGNEYEDMIKEYEDEENDDKAKELKKSVLGIRIKTLGNLGSHPENYSAQELERIIRAKIDERGINNIEIINILKACVGKSDEYQELVESIVIPSLDSYLKTGQPKITNQELFPVIKEYALGYLHAGDIEKCREIIRKGTRIRGFESTAQYQELKAAYPKDIPVVPKEEKKVNPEELKEKGFEGIDISDLSSIEDEEKLFEAFFDRLKILPTFIEIFDNQKVQKGTRVINNHIKRNSSIIPKEQKMRNIFKILRGIQEKHSDANITNAYVGKEAFVPQDGEKNSMKSFENYVIFEVDNTGYTILESFDESKEAGLFIVPVESLKKVVSMKRNDAKNEPEVECIYHRKSEKRGLEEGSKKDHYYISVAVDTFDKCLNRNPVKKVERNENSANVNTPREALEDMSTQELVEYLSRLDKDIEEAHAENIKIQEEVDAVVSDEANFRRNLIESIKGKQKELQGIRGEQKELRASLLEKQKIIDDAKKKVFGSPANKVGEEGPDDH